MTFTDIALFASGRRQSKRRRADDGEVPQEFGLFRTLLDCLGLVGDWEVPIPGRLEGVRLRWFATTSAAALASIWIGPICAVTSALLRGTDAQSEGDVFRRLLRIRSLVGQAVGKRLQAERRAAELCARPLIVRVPWPIGVSGEMMDVAARLETALMVAWLAADWDQCGPRRSTA